MHDNRMIAEVCPPGVCAIEKVSGSRIATPFAPPSPGSTPMITPRMIPANMRARFVRESATVKPCSSELIASTLRSRRSAQSEKRFHRPLRQRHLEPDLEDQIEGNHGSDTDQRHHPPGVATQPAHEEPDEYDRGNVYAEPADERHVRRRGHQHAEHQLELPDLDEGPVLLLRDQ